VHRDNCISATFIIQAQLTLWEHGHSYPPLFISQTPSGLLTGSAGILLPLQKTGHITGVEDMLWLWNLRCRFDEKGSREL
jgi:hypothetical protein